MLPSLILTIKVSVPVLPLIVIFILEKRVNGALVDGGPRFVALYCTVIKPHTQHNKYLSRVDDNLGMFARRKRLGIGRTTFSRAELESVFQSIPLVSVVGGCAISRSHGCWRPRLIRTRGIFNEGVVTLQVIEWLIQYE